MSAAVINELHVRADFEEGRGCRGQAALLRGMCSGRGLNQSVQAMLSGYDEQALEMYRWLGTEPAEPWLKGGVRG